MQFSWQRTLHNDVQYHFVRDMIEDKRVLLVKVDTLKHTTDAFTKSVSSEKFSWCRETMGIVGLDKWLSFLMAPCGKETSGRMLGYVIFFPRLAHIVNWRLEVGQSPPFVASITWQGGHRGFKGASNPPLWSWGKCPGKFCFLDPRLGWVNLPTVFYMFLAQGFGHSGFRSMVLDAMVFSPWYLMLRHV